MGSLYRSQHEMIFVFKSGKASHINNVELGRHGRYRTNVWTYPGANTFSATRDADLAMHPTVKPVALVADAILAARSAAASFSMPSPVPALRWSPPRAPAGMATASNSTRCTATRSCAASVPPPASNRAWRRPARRSARSQRSVYAWRRSRPAYPQADRRASREYRSRQSGGR